MRHALAFVDSLVLEGLYVYRKLFCTLPHSMNSVKSRPWIRARAIWVDYF